MAVQGKGILGAPSGIIGNINCYNRLGKSVVQSRSYPVNAYNRRWNLLKWQLSLLLELYWLDFDPSFISHWNSAAPASMSGQEFYMYTALERIKRLKLDNTKGSQMQNKPAFITLETFIYGGFSERVIYINVAEQGSFWPRVETVQVFFRFYLSNGTSVLKSQLFLPVQVSPIVFTNFSGVPLDYVYSTFQIQISGGAIKYNTLSSGILNPSFVPY